MKPYDGDLDAYRKFVLDGADSKPRKTEKRPKRRNPLTTSAAMRPTEGAICALRRRIEAAEAKMVKLEELLSRVDGVLADPVTFATSPPRLHNSRRSAPNW